MNKYVLPSLAIVLIVLFGCMYMNQSDCAPATLSRIFPNVNEHTMQKLCHTTYKGTSYENITNAFVSLSTNPLTLVFPEVNHIELSNVILDTEKPYLWIGRYKENGVYYNHMCIIKVTETNVLYSHSQYYLGTTNYYVVPIDDLEFMTNTFFIYSSEDIDKVRFY